VKADSLRRKQRRWWRSAEAQYLYWDEPHLRWPVEGPEGPGWYYPPCLDSEAMYSPLFTLRASSLREINQFASAWARWRLLHGPSVEERRRKGRVRREVPNYVLITADLPPISRISELFEG
jgi:hypothetical protein